MKRSFNPKSQHYHGNAIDIRFDKDGKELLHWLESDDGQQWMDDYHLTYLLEFTGNSRSYRYWKKRSSKAMINPHATGTHIHIQIKRSYTKVRH